MSDFEILTQREHVIKRPDTYIGSVEITTEPRWVYDMDAKKMIRRISTYNPGLEQCVMELLTNATDRSQTSEFKLTKIDVTVTTDTIEITNDGKGIPIVLDPKHNIYIPEMIFGNMLSGSNFKDNKKTTGGKNGIGAKAANIFSDEFTIITVFNGKRYKQTFKNRMSEKSTPEIKDTTKKDYTKIIFKPCLSAFGMKTLHENDTTLLIYKRTLDASAITSKNVTVTYNGEKMPVCDFQEYMDLYIGPKTETPRVYIEQASDISGRWSVGFAVNPHPSFVQVSFVNGICTEDGGTHVSHVIEPILAKIIKDLQERKEFKEIVIKKQYLKDNLIVFVRSLIEDPTFGSQTKTLHTTQVAKFGSKVVINDDIIKKIVKLGITNGLLELARAKELKGLKKTDGKKTIRLTDIPKLDDAHWAGTVKSHLCTLLLTEGDSAKSTALAGLAVVGKERYGVFPLKGKLLNTRDTSPTKIANNEEIVNINKILGLVHGEKYKMTENGEIRGLRYGKVMLMVDQDHDGSHIKGLLINYLGCFWPELLACGFVCGMLTPIIKAFKGSEHKNFYSVEDYTSWKENYPGSNNWRIKYYKGLGTSTSKEAKEYFSDLGNNLIGYSFIPGGDDQKSLELAFNESSKVNTDKRKKWIQDTLRVAEPPKVDYKKKIVSVNDFINKELVQFSIYDNERSIPSVMDGLKISQRKVLYGCLKRNLFKKADGSGEIKVAQLAGYVSEHSAYHHGEVSLHGTIVNMAQNFVGSGNNCNLLYPSGQFGSRVLFGKDAASPRYIFTYLNPWVSNIFNVHDNKLLKYMEDDGETIEPEFYVPVIPMVLLNSSEGIGTGWSTTIPCFNPKDVIDNINLLLENENNSIKTMHPWYKGFKGTITQVDTHEWRTEGVIEIKKKAREIIVKVTELCVGTVTQNGKRSIYDFKTHLDLLEQKDEILSYTDSSTDEIINFEILFRAKDVEGWTKSGFLEKLKLYSSIKTSNMHLFDSKGVIRKYETAEEIIWDFYKYRKSFYVRRKKHLVSELSDEYEKITDKARFIKMVVDGEIVVFKRAKVDIIADIEAKGFKKSLDNNYNHLLDIKIHSFTLEKYNELQEKVKIIAKDLCALKDKATSTMWKEDLSNFVIETGI